MFWPRWTDWPKIVAVGDQEISMHWYFFHLRKLPTLFSDLSLLQFLLTQRFTQNTTLLIKEWEVVSNCWRDVYICLGLSILWTFRFFSHCLRESGCLSCFPLKFRAGNWYAAGQNGCFFLRMPYVWPLCFRFMAQRRRYAVPFHCPFH